MNKLMTIEELELAIFEVKKLALPLQKEYSGYLEKDNSRSGQQIKFYWVIIEMICYFQKGSLDAKTMSEYLKENYAVETNHKKYFKKMKSLNKEPIFICTMSLKKNEICVKEFSLYMNWIESRIIKDHLAFHGFEDLCDKYNESASPKTIVDFNYYKWLVN